MTLPWMRGAAVLVAVLLGSTSHAVAGPVTLFSTFADGDALDADGWTMSTGPLDPEHFGLKVHFTPPSPADVVRLSLFESILIGLSTTGPWPDSGPAVPTIHFGLFDDVGGAPGALVAGAYVYWPLTSTASLFPTDPGWPLSDILLSTHQDYWFALSIFEDPGPGAHTMTWHFADGTTTPGLRLTGEVVPEPAVSLLLVTGLAGAWMMRRGRHGSDRGAPVV